MIGQIQCHECAKAHAEVYVSPARQPLVGIPNYDKVRLGIDFEGRHYLDLGEGPQHVLPMCRDCARLVPDNQKWALP